MSRGEDLAVTIVERRDLDERDDASYWKHRCRGRGTPSNGVGWRYLEDGRDCAGSVGRELYAG